MTVLETFGQSIIDHLQPHFTGYTVAFREPLETEVKPKTVWLSVDEFRISERAATCGQLLNLSARLYLAVFYEVSKTPAHYATVLRKRELTAQVLGGAARDANYGVAGVSLNANVEDEATVLTEGYFMTSTPIQLDWEVETL